MQGDNIMSLKKLPDNSIDSIVTDPPYGLSFMNKKWDYDVPSVEFWKEAYRVLKPGGHILSFGGTRTYHRMTVNIEDAGFEIRDQIQWLYGSGFPKSHNIGKSVDKIQGNEREVVGSDVCGTREEQLGEWGMKSGEYELTKGTSEWEGWGTALKPANEPICVARKPLSEATIADNVLKWGTGGINIDGCRIGIEGATKRSHQAEYDKDENGREDRSENWMRKGHSIIELNEGRFPANIILDEEAGEVLDEQSGISKSQSGTTKTKINNKDANWFRNAGGDTEDRWGFGDKGGASRFFYQAKVSKKERNMGLDKRKNGETPEAPVQKNSHPTVKPVSLMAYLCRLITPPNGIVLDPFMGSGSTGIAAKLEGLRFCGMEMDEDYFKIASARIDGYEKYREFLK